MSKQDISDAISVIDSVAGFCDESTPVGEAWQTVQDELERLQAIMERLPMTADGVRVVPGDRVWNRETLQASFVWAGEDGIAGPDGWYSTHFMRWKHRGRKRSGYCDVPISGCYSTREAAEAARDGQEEPDDN
jgi:hypothetical protein